MSTKDAEIKQDKSESVTKRDEPAKYTKAQILASKKYADMRDVLGAILDDKAYTIDEIKKLLDEFMKGKVK